MQYRRIVLHSIMFSLSIVLCSASVFAKYNVCSVTINSSNEREIFKKSLPPEDFNFIELTDYGRDSKGQVTDQWFNKACAAQVQCDVLLISGHYAGYFFASQGAPNAAIHLYPRDMEYMSCNQRCDGILKKPKEVFLAGCNTLAQKGKDQRTPEQYRQVLLADGMDRITADRTVEGRYGVGGGTSYGIMRRLFAGVPKIYGFNSKGPLGAEAEGYLRKYFSKVGNYKKHIEEIESAQASGVVLPENQVLKQSYGSRPLVEASGLMASDSGYQVREKICSLYQDKNSLEKKSATMRTMLESSERIDYVNVLSYFLSQLGSQATLQDPIASDLSAIRANKAVVDDLESLAVGAKNSPPLYLDYRKFQLQLGLYTSQDFSQFYSNEIRGLFKSVNVENSTLVCSLSYEHGQPEVKVDLVDINLQGFDNAFLPSMLSCSKWDDDLISQKLIDKFKLGIYSIADFVSVSKKIKGHDPELYQIARGLLSRNLSSFSAGYANLLLMKSSTDVQERREIVSRLVQNQGMSVALTQALQFINMRDNSIVPTILSVYQQQVDNPSYRHTLIQILGQVVDGESMFSQINSVLAQFAEQDKFKRAVKLYSSR